MNHPPLPDHLNTPRPTQIDAVNEICDMYDAGVGLVILDAPTGSGKTLTAEMVRREMDTRAIYTCTTKGLQDQFMRDFGGYARVLKGRSNYPTQHYPERTCDQCGHKTCYLCDGYENCPYMIAKGRALRAPVAVLNTSYLLHEANYAGSFGDGFGVEKQPMIIVDEADEMEKALMGFIEFQTWDDKMIRGRLGGGLKLPKKGARKATIAKYLEEYGKAVRQYVRDNEGLEEADKIKFMGHGKEALWVSAELQTLLGELEEAKIRGEEDEENIPSLWVRDYPKDKDERLVMKPSTVNRYGERRLWKHGEKWLCMSASIISPDEFIDSLGYQGSWGTVTMPMTFAVENRPIYLTPVAKVNRSEIENAKRELVRAIQILGIKYPNDRILVHTVSYDLADHLYNSLRGEMGVSRSVLTYKTSTQRGQALLQHRQSPNGVLIAPSMSRGYDFADDFARVVVVCKMPYPYLGDRQVSERMRLPGGQTWYTIQAIRDVVQMTGRGVRSETDWCHTYVLDAEFVKVWNQHQKMFPKWWAEAVQLYPMRELIKTIGVSHGR